MNKLWLVILALPLLLWARDTETPIANAEIDTLWVFRSTMDSVVVLVTDERPVIEYDGGQGTLTASTIYYNDSLGALVRVSKRVRVVGFDSTAYELRYTTEDTLPVGFRPENFYLKAAGFVVK